MEIERRLETLGLTLPQQRQVPPGARLPFSSVRLQGSRALISGHGPLNPDGSLGQPLGKVGAEVTREQAYQAARLTGLSMLGSLRRELGDLDRVVRWVRIFGMVNIAPDFDQMPAVINGCSDLLLELYGPDRGQHARSAVGMAGLPWGMPVEIEGEVEISA